MTGRKSKYNGITESPSNQSRQFLQDAMRSDEAINSELHNQPSTTSSSSSSSSLSKQQKGTDYKKKKRQGPQPMTSNSLSLR
jgi:hypothetical protein